MNYLDLTYCGDVVFNSPRTQRGQGHVTNDVIRPNFWYAFSRPRSRNKHHEQQNEIPTSHNIILLNLAIIFIASGWFIVLCSSYLLFVSVSGMLTCGIFLVRFTEYFQVSGTIDRTCSRS